MARHPNSRGASLRRSVGTRTPRKTLIVFCEGRRTEPEYLQALARLPSVRDHAAVDIRIETQGSVPMTLVDDAVAAKRRARDRNDEVDEFWCVFDVEWVGRGAQHHPNLVAAIEKARANGVRLAVTNPCFELWLILHLRDYAAFLDNDTARAVRKALDTQAGKGLDGSTYMPHIQTAAARAALLARSHEKSGAIFPHDNPSSSMYELIASVSP